MPLKDLTNKRFGYLLAVRYIKSRGGNGAIWECLCDCGKYCEVRSHSLIRGKTKSCGCKSGKLVSLDLSKPAGESNIVQLYNTYKNQAKLRGYCWCLSKEEFLQNIKQNCFYCNIEPSQKLTVTNVNGDVTLFYNGIDRKNNNIGYTSDNIVACCGTCNRAKNNLSFEEFIIWIKRLTKAFGEKAKSNYGE